MLKVSDAFYEKVDISLYYKFKIKSCSIKLFQPFTNCIFDKLCSVKTICLRGNIYYQRVSSQSNQSRCEIDSPVETIPFAYYSVASSKIFA